MRPATKSRIANLLLMLVSLVIALAAAEWVLRSISPDKYFVIPPDIRLQFRPDPNIMPGVSGPTVYTTNALGMRGAEPEETDRIKILILGGSTTECLYLNDDEAWPWLVQKQLEKKLGLKTWTGNVGRSGHTSRNNAFQAVHLIDQNPDIDALIVLAGINDLAIKLERGDGFSPFNLETAKYRDKVFQHSFSIIPPGASELSFFRGLALWQYYRAAKKSKKINEVEIEDTDGRNYVKRREERSAAGRFLSALPDLADGLEDFASQLRKIAAHGKAKEIPIVFLTQPGLWHDEMPVELSRLLWFGKSGTSGQGNLPLYYSTAALAKALDLYNQAILRVCRETDAYCIDIAKHIPKDTRAFYDDVHFNENGALMVAELVADGLVRLQILDD